MYRSIPIDLMKTFLTLQRIGSYSKTAEVVGRSQSAVSLQMKRLQEIVGSPLFTSSGKSLMLTQQGGILAEYAEQVVRLNDECIAKLDGEKLGGVIRIGIPSDFAISFLPAILGRFKAIYPNISLNVTCDLSSNFSDMIEARKLDIVVSLDDGNPSQYLDKLWKDPVSWVGLTSQHVYQNRPLPLVLFPERCQYRERIISALSGESIQYSIEYSSGNLAGNHAAIQAGLGVTALSKHTIPPYLQELPKNIGLPILKPVNVGLYWNRRGATKATSELAGFLVNILDLKLETILRSTNFKKADGLG